MRLSQYIKKNHNDVPRQFAKARGIDEQTVYRWLKEGVCYVFAMQDEDGAIVTSIFRVAREIDRSPAAMGDS